MDTCASAEVEVGWFVLYAPENTGERKEIALVSGLMGAQHELAVLCPLAEIPAQRETQIVPTTECVTARAADIRSGLIGFLAYLPGFGVGTIVAEAECDGMLHVVLEHERGKSGVIPITELRFTGLYVR